MKSQISAIELHYLIKELQILKEGRIDKIYHPNKEELLLKFHVSGKGKFILRIISGRFVFLTEEKESYGEPSGFCMFLRKHLDNTRLRKIEQKESERIIELLFEKKESKERLVIELFGGGNIIVCDESCTIISSLIQHKYKDRTIMKGELYKYPHMGHNLFILRLNDLKDIITNSKKDSIVTCLAIELGLGGAYSEEVCLLSNVKKTIKPGILKENEIKEIWSNIKKIINSKIKASIVFDKEGVKDVVPFELKIYDNYNKKYFKNYNEALDNYFIDYYKEQKKEKTAKEREKDRINRIIENQKEDVERLEKNEIETRKKAELIYNNYNLVNDILKELKEISKKHSWKEIKEKLKGHKIIKDINAKDKKIIVELK